MSTQEDSQMELVSQDVRYQIEQYKDAVNQAVEYVQKIEIEDRLDGEVALGIACEAINLADRIEETKKSIVEPSKRFIAEVNSLAKGFVSSLDQVKDTVVDKIDQWQSVTNDHAALETSTITVCERKDFAFDVTDLDKVPREFLTIDEARVKLAMKQGRKVIPGINITNTSKTYLKRRVA